MSKSWGTDVKILGQRGERKRVLSLISPKRLLLRVSGNDSYFRLTIYLILYGTTMR